MSIKLELQCKRCKEVIKLLDQGLTVKAVGHRLGLTEGGGKARIKAAMRFLDVGTREEMFSKARRYGWIE